MDKNALLFLKMYPKQPTIWGVEGVDILPWLSQKDLSFPTLWHF